MRLWWIDNMNSYLPSIKKLLLSCTLGGAHLIAYYFFNNTINNTILHESLVVSYLKSEKVL